MTEGSLPNLAEPLVDAVESADSLDSVGAAVGGAARTLIPDGTPKELLSGSWIGHSLHPLLTDLVIGSFTSATLLDVVGGSKSAPAAERLIAIGIAAYPPTALTGVSDYSDAEGGDPRVRRVGLVHAAANAAALGLFTASLVARRKGNRGRGRLLSLLGSGALGAAGHLGGHLSYGLGVGVEGDAADSAPSQQ